MKFNDFRVSAVFYFTNGTSKKIDWVERNLAKKESNPNKPDAYTPLELEEMIGFLGGKFKQWKEEGKSIVRKNIKGEYSLIPFSEVVYATFTVEQINENEEESKYDITKHPAHPNNYRK